jgi:hypothetical protein
LTTLQDALRELLRLPGSQYSCIADPDTGSVLAECTAEMVSDDVSSSVASASGAVLSWGADAARFLDTVAGDDLEDLMVTSRRAYHLVRQVEIRAETADRAAGAQRMLVYLCLDRARGNLAMARRQLAATRLGAPVTVPPQARSPAVERGGAAPAPAAGAGGPPVPRPRAAAAAHGPPPSVTAPVVPLPRRTPASLPPPPAPAQPVQAVPVAGRRWADDVGTMRRLLDGLRRLR